MSTPIPRMGMELLDVLVKVVVESGSNWHVQLGYSDGARSGLMGLISRLSQ